LDELQRRRCLKCDYLNNDIPINKKKPNCKNFLDCEVYNVTIKLKMRIQYLRGEIGPMFICAKDSCTVENFKGKAHAKQVFANVVWGRSARKPGQRGTQSQKTSKIKDFR